MKKLSLHEWLVGRRNIAEKKKSDAKKLGDKINQGAKLKTLNEVIDYIESHPNSPLLPPTSIQSDTP